MNNHKRHELLSWVSVTSTLASYYSSAMPFLCYNDNSGTVEAHKISSADDCTDFVKNVM